MLKLSSELLNNEYDDATWVVLNKYADEFGLEPSEYADLSNAYDGCAFE